MGKIEKTKPEKLGILSNLLSVGQWSWNTVTVLMTSAVGAGIMSWLASLTTWINSYGSIAWGAVGLATLLVLLWAITGSQAMIANSRLKNAQARIADKSYDTAMINPLDQNFAGKRISLHDLRTPLGEPLIGRVFNNCELLGPAVIIMNGGGLNGCTFASVEFGKIKNEFFPLPNKLSLEDCQLVGCKVYNVIFLVPEMLVSKFENDMPNMKWITHD